jgi:hypothetical protein
LALTTVFAQGTNIPSIKIPRKDPEKKLDKEIAT